MRRPKRADMQDKLTCLGIIFVFALCLPIVADGGNETQPASESSSPATIPPELRRAVGRYSGMGWTGYFRLWEEDNEIRFAAYNGGRDLNLSYTLTVNSGRPHLEFRGRAGTVMVTWELDYYHEHEGGAWIGITRGVGGVSSTARYYRVP